ncbi:MAG: response regulator [Candidatus Thiodiazotropha sp.]
MNFVRESLLPAQARENPLILVVDDDPGQLELQVEILREIPHCTILTARNGEKALQLIKECSLDLLLLDKCLPDVDGDEVCRVVRREYGNHLLPIIMVTGRGDSESLRNSLALGANDFIKKPFNAVELLSRSKSALEKQQLLGQLDSAESVLFALARMVEARDPTTGEHCSRLVRTSLLLGDAVGLDEREMTALRKGAVLHDIGKIALPDSILLKPGLLSEAEWQLMYRHSEIGADLCFQLNSVRDAVPLIRHHHERWDGSGYPDGLKGEAIPYLARLFQFVDIYDALRYERIYSPAVPVKQIIRIFRHELEKGWRDSKIGKLFLEMLFDDPEIFDAE